jgi:RNA polymerase sigma-70 factor (ECF subfamily)
MSSTPDTLSALYADELPRLRRHLVRRGLSAPAASDAVQDAFVRLLHTPREDIRDLRSYLRRSAESVAIDQWRRQNRAAAVIDPTALADETVPDPSPSADAVIMAREERLALAAAIEDLPPRTREVLILHRFDELSYAEIAERLGISRNTVMVHLANAMAALRRRLRKNLAAAD